MTKLDSILLADSTADAIRHLRDSLHVDHITLHMLSTPSPGPDNPFVRTTYPESWVGYYVVNNLIASDPILKMAQKTLTPFFWCDLELSEAQGAVIKSFQDAGLGTAGYSMIHSDALDRRSVLSVSRMSAEGWKSHIAARAELMARAHMDLHLKALAEATAAVLGIPQLAPREYECLRFTSQGKTYSEIAMILSLSEHTVRSYLKLARVKLNCVSLAQAVAKAVRYRMI